MYIVLDIGGTNTRIAKSNKGNSLDVVQSYPTPTNYQDGLNQIIKRSQDLSGEAISKIVIGVAGAFNKAEDSFVHSGNLKDWSNKKLGQDLSKQLGCPVVLQNDVALAALAEAKTGAGKNYKSIIYYSIGTGVGGAWVQNNQLVNNFYNFEPGHQIIELSNQTVLEKLISGQAIPNAADISDQELWDTIKQPLLIGLYNSFLHWPAEAIILGGGVVNQSQFFLLELEKNLSKMLNFQSDSPKILKSTHKDLAGLKGALELI